MVNERVLKELIQKCWDANPKNRPSSDEIDASIRDFIHEKKLKELKELSYDSINEIAIKNSSSIIFHRYWMLKKKS